MQLECSFHCFANLVVCHPLFLQLGPLPTLLKFSAPPQVFLRAYKPFIDSLNVGVDLEIRGRRKKNKCSWKKEFCVHYWISTISNTKHNGKKLDGLLLGGNMEWLLVPHGSKVLFKDVWGFYNHVYSMVAWLEIAYMSEKKNKLRRWSYAHMYSMVAWPEIKYVSNKKRKIKWKVQ